MQVLKALVIGMGVLIAAGLAVVIITVVQRAGGDAAVETTETPVPGADLRIALPWGAEIAETRISEDRLVLRLRHADGTESIEIFDPDTGRRLRRITIDRAR